jgi:hypothetical protein
LLHRPGASGAIVAVLVVREMTAPWATAAAAMLLAGSLVVVATLVRPTTTSTTPTATGHSIGVVIAASASPTASAVVRPVAPLRGWARRIDICFGNIGLEVVGVVVPRLDGIIHARAEVVLVGRGFLDGLFFHDFRRAARRPATSPGGRTGTLFGHSQIQREGFGQFPRPKKQGHLESIRFAPDIDPRNKFPSRPIVSGFNSMTGNNPQARANSCGGTQFEDRKRDPESATPSRPGWR